MFCWGCGTGDETPEYPKACADIYDDGAVPTFELEIAPNELTAMQGDCEAKRKQYRPATFRYGSETRSVMVRLKGNWSWRCEKYQFLISFNEVDSKARFHGLRKIVLDAPWYDPTLLNERMAFSFVKRRGLPASCVNHAKLMLNGAYYGVYSNVERIDKEYLERQFPGTEADGNLYDGGVELRTNEDVNDTRRRDQLLASRDFASIDQLSDLEQMLRVWATEAVLPNPDSYWAGVDINYFLYDHPTRGFQHLPYDMDMAARVDLGESLVKADPILYENRDWGRKPLYQTVLSNEATCRRFQTEIRSALDAYDPVELSANVARWATQISKHVADDPHKPYTFEQHQQGVTGLRAFFAKRKSFVESWLKTEHCPVKWP